MRFTTTIAAGMLLFAAPLAAQDADMSMPSLEDVQPAVQSDDIVGSNLYSVGLYVEDFDYDYDTEIGTDWDRIGEIANIVLNTDGTMAGLIVEVGGFLGIGDQHVFVAKQDLQQIDGDTNSDGIYFVTRLTQDEFEQMPAVGEGWFD